MKYLKKYKPESIIANFAAVNVFMLGGFLLGVKNRIAWYHTLTTQLDAKPALKFRKKIFYGLASKIATNSKAAKTDLINSFSIDPEKIEIVNNAVKDPGIYGDTEFNKIVFAGRLYEIKGVRVLIKALAIVKEEFKDIRLIIIGEDESTGELEELKKLQMELNLKENISFKGNRSRSYVLKQFSTACCSIVPSYAEAFGYVVIESFSVHTPVIGSNTTGISTIIREGEDGFLFKTGDHKDLAKKIKILLANKDLREEMSATCYQHFQENYELNKVIKELAENPEIFN